MKTVSSVGVLVREGQYKNLINTPVQFEYNEQIAQIECKAGQDVIGSVISPDVQQMQEIIRLRDYEASIVLINHKIISVAIVYKKTTAH